MTEDEILTIAAKRIAEVQRQRDKARRELSRAKAIIREMLLAFRADAEFDAYEMGDDFQEKVVAYNKAERFVRKRKMTPKVKP